VNRWKVIVQNVYCFMDFQFKFMIKMNNFYFEKFVSPICTFITYADYIHTYSRMNNFSLKIV